MNNRKRRIKYKPKIAHWAADLCVNHTGKPAFFLQGLRAPLRLSAFSCSFSESLCSDRELLLSGVFFIFIFFKIVFLKKYIFGFIIYSFIPLPRLRGGQPPAALLPGGRDLNVNKIYI